MQECDGNGVCLQQTINCNTYDKCPDFKCIHDCKPFPCPNEIICGSWVPKWCLGIKKNGLCLDCESKFQKKLDIIENTECPMCMDTETCVIQPNCTHPTCVECFKRCMYGKPDDPEPIFPYPDEIETEWEDGGRDDPAWCARYPLAVEWDEAWNKWDHEKDQKYFREQNLRKCPICRR